MAGNDLFTKFYAQLGGDATGTHDITLNGGVVLSPDSPYTSVGVGSHKFDGTNDHEVIADDASLDASGDLTAQFWVKTTVKTTDTTERTVIGNGDGSAGQTFKVHIDSSTGALSLTTGGTTDDGTTDVSDGSWHYGILRRTSGTWTLSVDGSDETISISNATTIEGADFHIGNTTAGNGHWNGGICDVEWIPGVSVTVGSNPTTPQDPHASAVLLACRYGEESQGSTAGHELTTIDGMVLKATGPTGFDGAMEFDGSSDKITIPDSTDLKPGTQSLDVSMFINVPSSETRNVSLVNKANSSGAEDGFSLQVSPSGYLFFEASDGGSRSWAFGSTDVRDSTYHHVAAIRNETNGIDIFLDGTKETYSSELNRTTIRNLTNSHALQFGYGYGSGVWGVYFDGTIANPRIDIGITRESGSTYPVPTAPYEADPQQTALACPFDNSLINAQGVGANASLYVYAGTEQYAASDGNVGFDFDGSTSLYTGGWTSDAGALTVTTYITRDSGTIAAAEGLFAQYTTGGGVGTMRLGFNPTGDALEFFCQYSSGSSVTLSEASAITDTARHNITVAYTPSDQYIRMYVDGVKVDESGPLSGWDMTQSSAQLVVGGLVTDPTDLSTIASEWTGIMDYLLITDTAIWWDPLTPLTESDWIRIIGGGRPLVPSGFFPVTVGEGISVIPIIS